MQENPPKFDLGAWCQVHFLNMRALEEVRKARLDLRPFLEDAKISSSRVSITDMTAVRKALAISFCTHTAINRTRDEYRTVPENTPGLLSPLSSLVGSWI